MTISSRTRRGSVYTYASASDTGYMTQSYSLQGTYFCRMSILSADERTVAEQAEHHERALFEFGDAVAVGLNDIIIENNVQWRVESSIVRRTQRARIVRAFRVDDDVYLRLLLFDGTWTLNGDNALSGYVSATS